MKRTMILAGLITAAVVSAIGQAPDNKRDNNDKAKKEVVALATEYVNALVKRDTAAAERILSDDYGDISASGELTTRFLLLRAFKETPPDYPRLEAINLDDVYTIVRIYDNTALLITKTTLKWQRPKEELAKKWGSMMPSGDSYIVTMMAVKKNGQWQIVSTHESEYTQKVQISPAPK